MEAPKFKPGQHALLTETGCYEDMKFVLVVREPEPMWPFKVLVLDGRTPLQIVREDQLTHLSLEEALKFKDQFLPIDVGLDLGELILSGDPVVYVGPGPNRLRWGIAAGFSGVGSAEVSFSNGRLRWVSIFDLKPTDDPSGLPLRSAPQE